MRLNGGIVVLTDKEKERIEYLRLARIAEIEDKKEQQREADYLLVGRILEEREMLV